MMISLRMKRTLRLNNRALSPIFATLILIGIIIVFGSAAYLYANNVTSSATNQLGSSIADSQKSMSQRLSFEFVSYSYPGTSPSVFTFYVLNNGESYSVKFTSLLIIDSQGNIVGSRDFPTSQLKDIDPPQSGISELTPGDEGFFTVAIDLRNPPVTGSYVDLRSPGHDKLYTLHLITEGGNYFETTITL